MKNKSVQNCRFVHHAKFHCIVTMLNRFFSIEFERGGTGKEPKSVHSCRFVHHAKFHCIMTTLNKLFKIEFERGELEKGSRAISRRDFKPKGLQAEIKTLQAPQNTILSSVKRYFSKKNSASLVHNKRYS